VNPPVVVVIGAGASHITGSYAAAERPPLTRQLFDPTRAGDLLKTVTLAQAAGRVIERDMKADSTIEFEEALRRMQQDGFSHHAQMGWPLIKPHGSVAWYVEKAVEFDPTAPPGTLSVVQTPIECVPTKRLELHHSPRLDAR
jgi:hypothetical protein